MIAKEKYLKTVRRPYPPFYVHLIMSGYKDEKNYLPFIGELFSYKNLIKSENIWYYYKESIKLAAKLAFDKWQNPKSLNIAVTAFKKQEQRLIKASNRSLLNFSKEYQAYMPAVLLPWWTEDLIIKKLKSKLPHNLLSSLNIPLQNNFYKQEEYDLLHTKNLANHVKKYQWINSRYGEINPYTVKQAKEKLKSIDKDKYLSAYKKEKKEIRKAVVEAKKILSKRDKILVDIMQFIVYYRTQRTDIMNKAGYLFTPQLKKIAKSKKLSYQQILHCTIDEINDKLPSEKIISDRIKKNTPIMTNGLIQILIGKEAEKVDSIFMEDNSGIDKLSGQIASKGLVSGKVKLVFNRNDLNKVKSGDILISSMTTPEMISAMKRAVAFVTDEGGITCHAAIISREMKKPCIIGTKIATKVFKDGDIVEVDANKGIVRKI